MSPTGYEVATYRNVERIANSLEAIASSLSALERIARELEDLNRLATLVAENTPARPPRL